MFLLRHPITHIILPCIQDIPSVCLTAVFFNEIHVYHSVKYKSYYIRFCREKPQFPMLWLNLSLEYPKHQLPSYSYWWVWYIMRPSARYSYCSRRYFTLDKSSMAYDNCCACKGKFFFLCFSRTRKLCTRVNEGKK